MVILNYNKIYIGTIYVLTTSQWSDGTWRSRIPKGPEFKSVITQIILICGHADMDHSFGPFENPERRSIRGLHLLLGISLDFDPGYPRLKKKLYMFSIRYFYNHWIFVIN